MNKEELKEKNFDSDTFIAGWYMPLDMCDKIIQYYEFNKEFWNEGTIFSETPINKDIKDSTDLIVGATNYDNIIGQYRKNIQIVLDKYMQKYPFSTHVDSFNIVENFNIQKYKVGGGFKAWHCEQSGFRNQLRHLAFMTYLNDVDDGGTEFYHQNIKTKAEKGLTLIWPTAWTHTHKGIISHTKEKYIVTGWYSFINKENR